MEMSKKIYLLRTENHLTQSEFAKIAGATDKAVSSWEKGTRSPKLQYTKPICEHFGIDLHLFIDESNDIYKPGFPSNILPMPKMVKKPRLGTIACGKPILAVEEADEFDLVPEDIVCDFTLRCKGDSMIDARICDGDIVYIRSQPEVENGQIAAVRVGDEATLKKVYYNGGRIILRACNPLYTDMEFEGERVNEMEVLGLAVGFTSIIRPN